MPTTTEMNVEGFYDSHSSEQRAALDDVLPWLEAAIDDLPLPADGRPIALLDLGSSEGGNAVRHGPARRSVRQRSDAPIWVFLDDLPSNDFNTLFAHLFPSGGPAMPPGVFSAAVGGNLFGRVVPPRTVHVVTTFNSVGWLDGLPGRLPGYILPMPTRVARVGVGTSEAERQPFRKQAAHDLERFYRARAEELVRGGKLLVEVFGRNEVRSTSDGLYDALSDALLDRIEAGALPRKVYEDLVLPVYFRSHDELLAPLTADAELAAAFEIERAETREVAGPISGARATTGHLAEWARSYTGFLRAFSEPVVARVLPDDAHRRTRLDEIYGRVEHLLTTDPDRYAFRYITVSALLTRR